jgi:hypothetical protein
MAGGELIKLGGEIASGLGRKFDDSLKEYGRELLAGKGVKVIALKSKGKTTRVALEKADADQIAAALRKKNIALTLSTEKFGELFPELVEFGYVPIPDYDYARGVDQIGKLIKKDNSRAAVKAAVAQNYLATDGLYTNPRSPIFRRIVGQETDPKKQATLINRAIRQNEKFYEDFTKDLQTNYGELDPITAVGVQGPLSAGSGPSAELLTFSNMVENPRNMFAQPADIPQGLRDVYGNAQTTYGPSSILNALRAGLSGQRWLEDPTVLSSTGGVFKVGSYSRNKLRAGEAFPLPGVGRRVGRKVVRDLEERVPVTLDRQANVAGLGGFRPLGSDLTFITNQDVYNFLSEIVGEVGAARGITADAMQARAWYPTRELMNAEVGGAAPIGRLMNPSEEAVAAFGRGTQDPRGIMEAADVASQQRLADDLAKATTAADRKLAQDKFNVRTEELKKIRKNDPRLMALAALAAGGAGVASLSGSSPASRRAAFSEIADEESMYG